MIYLDNSATTPVCKEAAAAVTEMMINNFGNPSSRHTAGMKAGKVLEEAREIIANKLGAESEEIFFTSGGTEANNLAVFGAVEAAKKFRNRKKIVVSATEHAAVYESAKELEKSGYEVIYLKPDRFGNITIPQIAAAIDENTILVSMMLVNNELGSVLPVSAIKGIVKAKNSPALIHCDCVQAFCKEKFTVKSLGADLVTVTAHKIFGPKGIGALYIRKGVRIKPRTFGGEQEKKLRTGTQAMPLIAGFAAAVKVYNTTADGEKVAEINRYAREKLKTLPNIVFNSDNKASKYILNFSLTGYRSETVLNFLSEKEICVSSGSACAKGNLSHVMAAITDDRNIQDSAIRISFSALNTKEEIDTLTLALEQAVGRLKTVK